jgi:hypothetical protein
LEFFLVQKCLKIAFWFSVGLAILSSSCGCMAGDYVGLYLTVALVALPGIFIQARLYKVTSALLFCAYLYFSYDDLQAGKRREARMQQIKIIQEKKFENP